MNNLAMKMSKVLIFVSLTLLANYIVSAKDPNMCIKDVEEVKELNSATKTKLEPQEECCEGYVKSAKEGEGCEPVQYLNSEEVLEEDLDSFESIFDPMASKSIQLNIHYFSFFVALCVSLRIHKINNI